MAYERLTLGNGYRVKDKEVCGLSDKNGDGIHFPETYNRLAELEDKIESGTLVELPCKVGDRVFGIDEWILNHVGSYRAIKEGTIVYINARITAEKIIYYYCIEYFDNIFKVNDTKSRSVCSHVFTTKEAAEEKLKELRGE